MHHFFLKYLVWILRYLIYYLSYIMYQLFHYEFDNILDIQNIFYKINIPQINNGIWHKSICYAPIPNITIQVFSNNMLLHKIEMDSSYKEILDEMKGTDMNNLFPTSQRLECFTPLFPYDMYEIFGYLSECSVKYKVICDVRIDDKLNLETFNVSGEIVRCDENKDGSFNYGV